MNLQDEYYKRKSYPIFFEHTLLADNEPIEKAILSKEYFTNCRERFFGVRFGTLLKSLRDDSDIVTGALSLESGVSQSYISQLENNVRLPSDKIINKLSKGFSELAIKNSNLEEFYFSMDVSEVIVDSDLNEKLTEEYKLLLEFGKEQSKKLDLIDDEKEDYPAVKVTEQEVRLLNAFRMMENEPRDLFITLSKYLTNDGKDTDN